jgi:hypothetical protein
LLGQQEQRGDGGRVVGLVLAGVVDGDAEVEEGGDPASGGGDALDPLDGSGGEQGQPQASFWGAK